MIVLLNSKKVTKDWFLGDAILGAIVAKYLYEKFPRKDEGFLTKMRSKIVSRQSLNTPVSYTHLTLPTKA